MEQERAIKLIARQIKDIQSQADKVLSSDKSNAAIENFARYSVSLKQYIAKNTNDKKINSYLTEIPDIKYSRINVKLWQYLILPMWFWQTYKDYIARN